MFCVYIVVGRSEQLKAEALSVVPNLAECVRFVYSTCSLLLSKFLYLT